MEAWPIRTLLDRSCSNRSALPHGPVDYDTGWSDDDDCNDDNNDDDNDADDYDDDDDDEDDDDNDDDDDDDDDDNDAYVDDFIGHKY